MITKTNGKLATRLALPLLAMTFLAGCSTDENPITPEKMQQIRQKEQSERKNFNPSMTAPPAQGGTPKK